MEDRAITEIVQFQRDAGLLSITDGELRRTRRVEACRRAFVDRASSHRSITDIALGHGFQNMAHFSRVFRAHLGMPPSDSRRAAAA